MQAWQREGRGACTAGVQLTFTIRTRRCSEGPGGNFSVFSIWMTASAPSGKGAPALMVVLTSVLYVASMSAGDTPLCLYLS